MCLIHTFFGGAPYENSCNNSNNNDNKCVAQ